ncbi:MAG: carboxypeptidase M32 [Candidatus Lokiarchaeota archaeon]|nr:carboxypeptidase M32 [Candidatus Lokiarchaeota archaeon]
MKNAYTELAAHMKDIKLLGTAMSIIGWDMRTVMPSEGAAQRTEQLALLSKVAHDWMISDKTKSLLESVHELEDLNNVQLRNLELWQRDFDLSTKLPSEFVRKFEKQRRTTETLWIKARPKNDYKMVQPELQKLFELLQKKASYLDPLKHPYDVLIDLYEKNATQKDIDSYFGPLKTGIMDVMHKCLQSSVKPNPNILKIHANVEFQKRFSDLLWKLMGMSSDRSNLFEAAHPFTTGYAKDVRITTHYHEDDPIKANMFSLIHEAGHALYELNLPEEHWWTPVGSSISMGIHESQSRFPENILCKSREFLTYIYPHLQEILTGYKEIPLENFILAVNIVNPSLIRIYADEVTYSLHVILRYEIERDLFNDKTTITELPHVWNQKMRDILGIEVPDNKDGVLQDTHWYQGLHGYFPSYALGNIYDGNLLYAMEKEVPNWKEEIANGNLMPAMSWMKENVHRHGSMYDPIDLIEKVTGEKPNSKYFVQYLNEKFSKIYKF